jgi:RNA polymerase sigma-70 factor (ECF subfamily)
MKNPHMIEKDQLAQIIAGCKHGDAESFSQLVDIYADKCYGYFYRMTCSRDISDDLLSELFVKLVQKIGTYSGGGFNGWIFRVTGNVFYDYLRHKYRDAKVIESRKEAFEEVLKRDGDDGDERIDKIQKQLSLLDVETRELIMLRFYSGMSFKEIAQMKALPTGTILSKVHRGLKKLKELMGVQK